MDDLDIDELLECDDIEQTAFISSSKHLLKVFDNLICGIDDRINQKRSGAYYGGYYGGGNYHQENYNHGYDMYGYHKQQSQSHHFNNMGSHNGGNLAGPADSFDKTRKISVLY